MRGGEISALLKEKLLSVTSLELDSYKVNAYHNDSSYKMSVGCIKQYETSYIAKDKGTMQTLT